MIWSNSNYHNSENFRWLLETLLLLYLGHKISWILNFSIIDHQLQIVLGCIQVIIFPGAATENSSRRLKAKNEGCFSSTQKSQPPEIAFL
ncbi:Hypothetical predicted protein [Podarcis lilfordi]|uniref:Uncharacterized protein n=1 Tax=Podarcis lilfordi TaxID=74358 RepID=A0AA35PTW9_9SAUR|nr:Hypothetical predicted protein [Podarcis lilfordi]